MKIVGSYYEDFKNLSPDNIKELDESLWGMATVYGAYLGKVLRTKFGGNWIKHQDGLWELNINGNKIYPIEKVYKRVKNGVEDSLIHYFSVIEEILKK